jgi:hypothetical protein
MNILYFLFFFILFLKGKVGEILHLPFIEESLQKSLTEKIEENQPINERYLDGIFYSNSLFLINVFIKLLYLHLFLLNYFI